MPIANRSLPSGTKLVASYKKQSYSCTVGQDEDDRRYYLLADGRRFTSPSAAANTITGTSVNGWRFWSDADSNAERTADGPPAGGTAATNPGPGTRLIIRTGSAEAPSRTRTQSRVGQETARTTSPNLKDTASFDSTFPDQEDGSLEAWRNRAHLASNVIPRDQRVIMVDRSDTVSNALGIMMRYSYSQLPVMKGRRVLGMFSYRSLATRLESQFPQDLRVEDFCDKPQFCRVNEDVEEVIAKLNKYDAVIVGDIENLKGIVTAADVLEFLNNQTVAFVLLQEIETTLRELLRLIVASELIGDLSAILARQPSGASIKAPVSYEDLNFGDYVTIISDGRTYERFAMMNDAFGPDRKHVSKRLNRIRELRNDAFHFKRTLTTDDRDELAEARDWLRRKLMGMSP